MQWEWGEGKEPTGLWLHRPIPAKSVWAHSCVPLHTGPFIRQLRLLHFVGARPQMAPSPTGVLVLLSLNYLTSLFYYIPKSALAAVIIMAVAPLFDAKIFRTLWRVKSMYACIQGRQPLTRCLNAKGVF